MKLVGHARQPGIHDPAACRDAITDEDRHSFEMIVSTDLNEEQIQRVVEPAQVYPQIEQVLAIHWHPEHIPMALIEQRIEHTFPRKINDLIIPTQHNAVTQYGEFMGVEVDCYSAGFNQKVQLLIHFPAEKAERASMLQSMLSYTHKYRSTQLFDLIETIITPRHDRIALAVSRTGADEMLLGFVQTNVRKIDALLRERTGTLPQDALKNKLLRNFFDTLRPLYGDGYIERAQAFVRVVKRIVKAEFPMKYFYRTEEIIEEARSFGCGIVVPHPEQFWPILLAEYDVDGYEVWNPQSRRYSEFLIDTVARQNQGPGRRGRRILIFMGDDTHVGEKVKEPEHQEPAKVAREIGVQPAWEDPSIRKKLIIARMERKNVIDEYRQRLIG